LKITKYEAACDAAYCALQEGTEGYYNLRGSVADLKGVIHYLQGRDDNLVQQAEAVLQAQQSAREASEIAVKALDELIVRMNSIEG